jgi:Zn-dependent protease with chaperone function
VSVAGGVLDLQGDGIDSHPLTVLRQEPRSAISRGGSISPMAALHVPAGFELPGLAAPAARVDQWVTSLEGRWHVALLAAVIVLGLLWGAIVFGVPALSKQVAMRMSPVFEEQMGLQTLSALDRIALKPTTLTAERQASLTARFAQLVQLTSADARYTLLFRASPAVGPNAFALPGGTVVLLDELVQVAENDDEIMAVLAHEIGHLHERHTMRLVLQTSVAGVLVAAVVGDVLSASSYAAALPAFLLQTRYSREFETEADDFGLHPARSRRHRSRALHPAVDAAREGPRRRPSGISVHASAHERARTQQPIANTVALSCYTAKRFDAAPRDAPREWVCSRRHRDRPRRGRFSHPGMKRCDGAGHLLSR